MNESKKKVLLIIDDDKLFCEAIVHHFSDGPFEVLAAHTASAGRAICSGQDIDIVLLDQKLPDGRGVDICPDIIAHNEKAKIIFITAYPEFENAKAAVQFGAYDYLSKPFDIEELEMVIHRASKTMELERVQQVQEYRENRDISRTELIGKNSGLARVFEIIKRASENSFPVLITGETGVGKSLIAKYIHYKQKNRRGSFINVNCASIPENLIEAELFGYEKGAFTGAIGNRKGLFEMAENGTLLLDEIGELAPHLQAKLLDAIEENKIRRVGGTIFRPLDVRVMAATNIPIENAIEKGEFRADLFYRIGVIQIHVPPLRDRVEDLPELCRHFLEGVSRNQPFFIPDDEMKRLESYGWPGNVRELRNVLERATILRQGSALRPSGLLNRGPLVSNESSCDSIGSDTDRFCFPIKGKVPPTLERLEQAYIRFVLEKSSDNRSKASEILGISRSTLIRRIKSSS